MVFEDLDVGWRRAFAQAWHAHVRGSIGVGAVLVDPAGSVVVEGRNRVGETTALPGRMHGTYLAHAEVDVMAQLPVGDYDRHTIRTTLEPCVLCLSAAVTAHVGSIEFAAPDPLWIGTERMPAINPQIAKRWPATAGPLTGPVAAFGAILPMIWFLQRQGGGSAVSAYEDAHFGWVTLARRLADGAVLKEWCGDPVEVVFDRLWGDLEAADS
jgi:tRNA(Arg) A34 adenosine deaminase TadA